MTFNTYTPEEDANALNQLNVGAFARRDDIAVWAFFCASMTSVITKAHVASSVRTGGGFYI